MRTTQIIPFEEIPQHVLNKALNMLAMRTRHQDVTRVWHSVDDVWWINIFFYRSNGVLKRNASIYPRIAQGGCDYSREFVIVKDDE